MPLRKRTTFNQYGLLAEPPGNTHGHISCHIQSEFFGVRPGHGLFMAKYIGSGKLFLTLLATLHPEKAK